MYIYQTFIDIAINLLEQLADAFVQFSDLAKNWHFSTPINVNISKPPPLHPKISDIQRISLNALNVCGNQNWIGGWGVCEL